MRVAFLLASLMFALCATVRGAQAQGSERGRALVDYYPASVHDGGPNHFRAEVIPDGRLAVANGQGLLLFDGARWQMTRHPDRLLPVFALAHTPDNGRFYGGFPNDVGYFAPEPSGEYAWHSVTQRVAPARDFGHVFVTLFDARRNGIFYVTTNRVFFASRDEARATLTLEPKGTFASAYAVDGAIWLHDTQAGLVRVGGDTELAASPVTPLLASGQPLGTPAGIGAIAGGQLLMLVTGELYALRAGALTPIAQDNWPQWKQLRPTCFHGLRDGRFAVGFRRSPPWVIDADGTVVERYDELSTLAGVSPRGFAEDGMGGLWVSQANSLLRIDRGSGLTMFGQNEGVPRSESMIRWRGQLYTTSADSLHRLVPAAPGQAARFELVRPDKLAAAMNVTAVGDDLIVNSDALFRITAPDTEPVRIARFDKMFGVGPSAFHPGRGFASTNVGQVEIDFSTTPAGVSPIPGTAKYGASLLEIDADNIWLFGRAGDIARLRREAGVWGAPQVPDKAAIGLPAGPLNPSQGPSGLWIASNRGVYLYKPQSEHFEQPAQLPRELATRAVLRITEDIDGNLWAQTDAGAGVAWREGDTWRWDETALRPLDRSALLLDVVREGRIAWLLRTDGVARLDLDARAPPAPPVAPRVVRVEDLRKQSLLGLAPNARLGADTRDLRLSFALPAFERPPLNQLRSRLAGYESQWSEWSTRLEREYTNLPDGAFELQLEGRDALGRVSQAAALPFTVLAPWWRSVWAYAGYGLGAGVLLWLAARFGARRRQHAMLARQRELEAQVDDRTRELKRTNEQLAEQAERLLEVDRLKTRFFVNVGHEFRTPLTLVLGPIEDLLRDASARLSERVREQLELAHRNARRVLALIVEILDVNRLEHGHLAFRCERIALDTVLRRAIQAAQPLAERHGHTLTLDVVAQTPIEVDADPLQIERCVSNLIGNAAKFMPRGGRIEVTLDATDGRARVRVRDYGRGIAVAALPHVFDRFLQTEGGDEASGYGVGLALVREIVTGHGGSVDVESALGVGSTFSVMLPLAADAAVVPSAAVETPVEVEPAAARAEPIDAPRERPLVLVVDDHDDLRLRLRHLFEARFEVAEAADGPSAWRAATERLPDVIVCDVMMPGFDGVELTRRLRANPETAAIALLLLTAKAGSEHAVVGLNAGANDYLEKPFDSSELLARVESLLAQAQRLRHQLARAAMPIPEIAPAQETPDERWRRRLDAAIDARLDDSTFGVDGLAQAIHGDRSTVFRKSKQQLGMSPSEYLRERRLARGRDLLLQSAGSVSEVAYAVGFDSLASFTRAFKARYGEPPSAVRTVRSAQAL
jgi:signal transduction histidine kinase/DNA-binding response OmpR family regulator